MRLSSVCVAPPVVLESTWARASRCPPIFLVGYSGPLWRWLILWTSLQSSRDQFHGKDFPNFEMLDAKIASALNKIIQNSLFKKKVSLEEQNASKEDRLLRGIQFAFMNYD